MTSIAPFQSVLEALLDDARPFPARYLHRFSDIPPADLALLIKAWPQITNLRKHTLLDDLEELAESDTLTSFDDLARPLLKDVDPLVRQSAIRLLWENEDVRLAPVFLKILEEDEDPRCAQRLPMPWVNSSTWANWKKSRRNCITRSKMISSGWPLRHGGDDRAPACPGIAGIFET